MIRRWIPFVTLIAACTVGLGCGGGSSSHLTSGSQASGHNVQPITVNNGPDGNYANGVFTSVTVCAPGGSTCQTIDNVLVDTGSSGLRLLSSALTLSLPQQNGPNGNPVVECLPFMTGATWGPVHKADVTMAGEKASGMAIQVASDTAFPVAEGCKNFGVPLQDTLATLGANGILGIGLFVQDCGRACSVNGASNPGLYYECSGSNCQVIAEPITQQVANPVAAFATDNNGVVISLPDVSTPQPSLNGSLIFGIGTQSNNAPGSATVYSADAFGNFTAIYKGQQYSSFIDSGSNVIFFLDSSTTGIPACSNAKGFYCPSAPENLAATDNGANGTTGTINFTVGNADTLLRVTSNAVFADLAGPSAGIFDWGLPFFYGRNVFVAIEGKNTPVANGPYWAY